MFSAYIKEAEPLKAEEESRGGDELTGTGLDSRKFSYTQGCLQFTVSRGINQNS